MAAPNNHRKLSSGAGPTLARILVILLVTVLTSASWSPALAQPQPPDDPCPNAAEPPPPGDTSEVPPPGEGPPKPLPVPESPVGGERLGECGLVNAADAPPPPEDVQAESWLVADMASGEVLAAQDPHARHRPASTIKVLTALLAVRDLDMRHTLEATQEDADAEGSRVGLEPGVTYSVEQLVAGLLLQSGNDAAHALGRALGGQDVAAERMTQLANRLGARDTRVATPSGLDGPGMSTSAYDLALLFRKAMSEPKFAELVSTEHTELPGPPEEPPLDVWTNNQVLLNYPGGIGGKTGFTNDARHTFIGAAERDGRQLVTVLMRGEQSPVRLSEQSERLLDYGFELPAPEPVGQLVTPTPTQQEAKPTPGNEGNSPASAQAQNDPNTGSFGTLALPLTVLGIAVVTVAGVVAVRQRRARAATSQRAGDGDGEHP